MSRPLDTLRAALPGLTDYEALRTVADLGATTLGHTIRIPDLHQPGNDFDAPRVDVTGRLEELTRHHGLAGHVVVSVPGWFGTLPLDHPIRVLP